jgi:universal stress protein A
MLAIKTILHPTDFSDNSLYAFRVACSLARDYGARVIVAHVMSAQLYNSPELGPVLLDPIMIQEEMQDKLRALRRSDSVAVEHRVCLGDVAAEIVALAQDKKCDLIVMGTHGRSALSRVLIGSITEAVLHGAPCPVLTLKMPFPADAPPTAASPAESMHA